MVSCGSKLISIVLTIFNALWLVTGILFLYVGVHLVNWNAHIGAFTDLAHVNLKTVGIYILIIGAVVAFIAILGCYGSCCENACALNIYASLIIVLIMLEVYVMIISNDDRQHLEHKLENATLTAIRSMRNQNKTAIILEQFQYSLKCCGWNGTSDYERLNETLPGSCCGIDPTPTNGNYNAVAVCNLTKASNTSCRDALKLDTMSKVFGTNLGFSIALMMFELIIVLAACCLAREVQLEKSSYGGSSRRVF